MPAEPTETRISVCSHDCPDACSLRVTVREGRLVSLRGDPAHPITQGILCGKVSRYAERVFHPRRILTPQRRVGAKGEGRFQPVSWEEALDEIAARFTAIIREHGAQAILPFSYGGTVGHLGFNAGHPFFHALGASRLDRTICVGTATAGLRATTGIGAAADLEQVVDAKLILLWGLNAVATHVHLMPLLKRARAKGAQVVVIDPYRTATARQAHRWLQIRPGTDAALAMGLMRELLALGLHDRAFIAQYTHGFEALRESCQPYTPEHTEALTGIPAAEVRALARDYGGTRDSFIRLGLGMSRHAGGGMAVRTVACLPAVTGAWEGAAGGLLGLSWSGMWLDTGILTRPRPEHPGARLVNMVRLGEALTALDNPPVKALYVYNANPAATVPHQSLVQQGLAREDLFVVVHEQMPTDTVDYADLVLPATNFLEHDDLLSGYGHDYLQYSRPALAPAGQARSNLDTFADLARRMGLAEPAYAMTPEQLVLSMVGADNPVARTVAATTDREALLAGHPVKLAKPRTPWREKLRTPSGRFEFFSGTLERSGLPGAPDGRPAPQEPGDAAYPLVLLAPPAQHFLNASFGESASSRRLEWPPRLKMHPRDATARNLAADAPCRIFNGRGECFLTVEITEDTAPGVIVAESIWWPRLLPGRKGINQLTTAVLSDMGDGARFHDARVQVEPARTVPPALEVPGGEPG